MSSADILMTPLTAHVNHLSTAVVVEMKITLLHKVAVNIAVLQPMRQVSYGSLAL